MGRFKLFFVFANSTDYNCRWISLSKRQHGDDERRQADAALGSGRNHRRSFSARIHLRQHRIDEWPLPPARSGETTPSPHSRPRSSPEAPRIRRDGRRGETRSSVSIGPRKALHPGGTGEGRGLLRGGGGVEERTSVSIGPRKKIGGGVLIDRRKKAKTETSSLSLTESLRHNVNRMLTWDSRVSGMWDDFYSIINSWVFIVFFNLPGGDIFDELYTDSTLSFHDNSKVTNYASAFLIGAKRDSTICKMKKLKTFLRF